MKAGGVAALVKPAPAPSAVLKAATAARAVAEQRKAEAAGAAAAKAAARGGEGAFAFGAGAAMGASPRGQKRPPPVSEADIAALAKRGSKPTLVALCKARNLRAGNGDTVAALQQKLREHALQSSGQAAIRGAAAAAASGKRGRGESAAPAGRSKEQRGPVKGGAGGSAAGVSKRGRGDGAASAGSSKRPRVDFSARLQQLVSELPNGGWPSARLLDDASQLFSNVWQANSCATDVSLERFLYAVEAVGRAGAGAGRIAGAVPLSLPALEVVRAPLAAWLRERAAASQPGLQREQRLATLQRLCVARNEVRLALLRGRRQPGAAPPSEESLCREMKGQIQVSFAHALLTPEAELGDVDSPFLMWKRHPSCQLCGMYGLPGPERRSPFKSFTAAELVAAGGDPLGAIAASLLESPSALISTTRRPACACPGVHLEDATVATGGCGAWLGQDDLPALIGIELADTPSRDPARAVRISQASVSDVGVLLSLPRRRPGELVQASYKLGALVMYRRSQAGGGGHYKTIVRSPDGWRSYDGMESGGVGVRIRSPEGDHLPWAGHWFPVEVVYERVG